VRRFPLPLFLLIVLLTRAAVGQSPNGTISGLVLDTVGSAIPGAELLIVNDATGVRYPGTTNKEGIYAVPNLPPGPYRIQVSKLGFKTLIKPDIILNVQDALAVNFTLPVGAISETVTVEGRAPLVNTESAAVSTVVDRQFAENLPMNGRSFQTLIQLTPGVVLTASNTMDGGQFSVNGQRAASNYWMVDGVSANIGIGVGSTGNPGNGLGGSLASFSALGGTNSLVSVDAMQEFRIQTSTYAPEFGRSPGGQISIVTRSGPNQFHGSAFEYVRNDLFDANDWFNGYTNDPPLPKAKERQNDFGGTVSGPIIKERTFFFFSYEGLRLRLPETSLTTVPDITSRQNAVPAMQPYLNAFPLPNGSDNAVSGYAEFNASYSNPATLDAYSLRIDHRLSDKLTLFGRYNYSPSAIVQRGGGVSPLSTLNSIRINTQTATLGVSSGFSPTTANDFRFNYSRTSASSVFKSDNFGGAVPLLSLPFPDPFTSADALFTFYIFSLQQGSFNVGKNERNEQRQLNLVDSLVLQRRTHSLKFGVDYRRLSPLNSPTAYIQDAYFADVPSAETGALFFGVLASNVTSTFLFRNLGMYAQDTWRASKRLTMTYGVRWDVDFVPQSLDGAKFPAVTGYDLNDLSTLALAAPGTSPYQTTYGNLAPRFGMAYQLRQSANWQTVLRGGVGIFYDLASSEVGNVVNTGYYPFGATAFVGGTFPLDSAEAAPPAIQPPNATNAGTLYAFDPHLRLPYTIEWNASLEQALGTQQSISASYIGSAGRRLLQTAVINAPNPNLGAAILVGNGVVSDYDALQIQFQHRLSHNLQVLSSYTWAHSIDTGSAGSSFVAANVFVPSTIAKSNRGPSDFDIRNAVSAAVTYDIPSLKGSALGSIILGGWSLENVIQARSAPPVNISDGNFSEFNSGIQADIRPDLVPGQSLYVYGRQFPGGKGFNPAAFADPPVDPSTGNPLRQGDVPRNFLRGFTMAQWDFGVHRNFPIHESVTLQFRAEMFNLLNHPNFGPPLGTFGRGGFGLSQQMLGQYLDGGGRCCDEA
jgi:Carboxypeptidase regulatory-like domain/TonB dependent receptor